MTTSGSSLIVGEVSFTKSDDVDTVKRKMMVI
jgi:hypothetical protein